MPTNGWGALLFSVSRNSPGLGCTAVAFEAGAADGPGADLFSLVYPGSTLPSSLNCVPIGVAQRATDSGEMGFATASGQKPEMQDFDPHFTFYRCASPIPSYLQDDPWLYFSVPRSFAGSPYIATWFTRRGPTTLTPPTSLTSGATILRMRWQSTAATPHWTPPEVFLSYNELGLLRDDDIDAVSVDEGHGLVLLSLNRSTPTARTAVDYQLMVASYTTPPMMVTHTARTYYYDTVLDTREPMGKIAGADGGGEIDASCPVDPSGGNGLDAAVFGYIIDCRSDLPFPVTMEASGYATAGGGGLRGYAISLSGAPAGGLAGLVIGFPGPGGGPTLGGPSMLFFAIPSTLTYEWSVPAVAASLGWMLDFQWAAISGSAISLARTVRLRV